MGVSRCFKEKILQGALLNQKKVGFKLVHTQLILYCFDHDDHQRVNKAIEYIHPPPPPPHIWLFEQLYNLSNFLSFKT